MNPLLLLLGFGFIAAEWTTIWAWVVMSVHNPKPQAEVEADASLLRRKLFYVLSGLTIAIFATTIHFLPYVFIREAVAGKPGIKVKVVGRQWDWTLSRSTFPVGVPVQFDVTSDDVNHGFGLYDPEGHLVGDTQAMPGFTNRLIYTFKQRGVFMIRCLEYCGDPHYLMTTQITVV